MDWRKERQVTNGIRQGRSIFPCKGAMALLLEIKLLLLLKGKLSGGRDAYTLQERVTSH